MGWDQQTSQAAGSVFSPEAAFHWAVGVVVSGITALGTFVLRTQRQQEKDIQENKQATALVAQSLVDFKGEIHRRFDEQRDMTQRLLDR